MFKTTLLRALRSAERVEISGYEMEVLDYDLAIGNKVSIVLDSCEMRVFFDGTQEITIAGGSATAMACADPENEDEEDWGDLFEVEGYPKDEPLYLEFKMMQPMTEGDLL